MRSCASVAAVLGQPFDRLWGKTMLCGTVGAPRAPACFNGSPYVPIPIATGVDPQRALTLMEQPEKFPGIGVAPEPARSYPAPAGANAAHLLGWVARAGADDVESGSGRSTPRTSSGGPGSRRSTTPCCAVATARPSWPSTPEASSPGRCRAQARARIRVVTTSTPGSRPAPRRCSPRRSPGPVADGLRADAAAAVVLDVTNGAVVAAASNPAYDPGVFTGGISRRSSPG